MGFGGKVKVILGLFIKELVYVLEKNIKVYIVFFFYVMWGYRKKGVVFKYIIL